MAEREQNANTTARKRFAESPIAPHIIKEICSRNILFDLGRILPEPNSGKQHVTFNAHTMGTMLDLRAAIAIDEVFTIFKTSLAIDLHSPITADCTPTTDTCWLLCVIVDLTAPGWRTEFSKTDERMLRYSEG